MLFQKKLQRYSVNSLTVQGTNIKEYDSNDQNVYLRCPCCNNINYISRTHMEKVLSDFDISLDAPLEDAFKLIDLRCEYCQHSLNYTRKENEH